MAYENEIKYRSAHREVHDAFNEIRKTQGESLLPYPPELEACSFCGKKRNEGRRLLMGIGVGIFDQCAALANKTLNE